MKDGKQYTEKEYRNFGWARANNILNEGQNADYRSKFANAKVGRAKFNKSKNGEYIIPVSDIYNSSLEGINNVLVFAKGTITNPIITSVIEIYEYDETNLDRVRRQIYEGERRGIQQKTGELFGRYFSSDFEFQPNQQGAGFEGIRNSGDNRYRGRSSEETSSIKETIKIDYSLKETDGISTKDRKELIDIIEHLKGEFEVTKFAKADSKKLAKMTRDILKEYSSKAEYDVTYKAIDELYQYMANGEDGHPAVWEDVYNKAYNVAKDIIENALVADDYMYQEYVRTRNGSKRN